MTDQRCRELYRSSNGDVWELCADLGGDVFAVHRANAASGGAVCRMELADFLARGNGPEQQALIHLIGTLL